MGNISQLVCPKCGGTILGDGYSTILHCEFADEEDYFDLAPDEKIVYCRFYED